MQNRDNKLWNRNLSNQERLDFLMEEMTQEEKLSFLATSTPALERLGIPAFYVGGEAAHGVEARHDQNGSNIPEVTTSLPQPIGMSATWDPELLKEAGDVVGEEVRALYEKNRNGGLFRWAPTVDLCRDPRWGRTEEGYGEDPYLTGEIAGAYIQGMQRAENGKLRMSCALKHFFANNVEDGRVYKSSSVDADHRFNYYYEPFRRCVEKGATSVMTAYNAVNGNVCMTDGRVDALFRKKWGMHGHVVCDGGAFHLVTEAQKSEKDNAHVIAAALHAGVDAMTDDMEMVHQAAVDALEQGMITMEDVEQALRHTFTMKLRLGIFDDPDKEPVEADPAGHGFGAIADKKMADLSSAGAYDDHHREVASRVAEESLVLLKNNGVLPLPSDISAEDVAVVGPLADRWFQDWYGGEPAERSSILQGMTELLGGGPAFDNGLDKVRLQLDEQYVAMNPDGHLYGCREKENAATFYMQDWGHGAVTFLSSKLDRYVSCYDDGTLRADKLNPFGWFVKEIFYPKDGQILNWQKTPLKVNDAGEICPAAETEAASQALGVARTGKEQEKEGLKGSTFTIEVLEKGAERAAALAKGKKAVIAVCGSCPMINGKEDYDRPSTAFPQEQRSFLQEMLKKNENTILILESNYPYNIDVEEETIPAILQTATGGQAMGKAVAKAVLGWISPAGRLSMTWYGEKISLPDMDDYDIKENGRTYRWLDEKPLYAFGHGLSYGKFTYSDLRWGVGEDQIQLHFVLKNEGEHRSDEVVQVYIKSPMGGAKRPIHQLVAFQRVPKLLPGESRVVSLYVPLEELHYYDIRKGGNCLRGGEYVLEIGAASDDIRLEAMVHVDGEEIPMRNRGLWISADHYDRAENVRLWKGSPLPENPAWEACTALVLDKERPATLEFHGFVTFTDSTILRVATENGLFHPITVLNEKGEKIGRLTDENGFLQLPKGESSIHLQVEGDAGVRGIFVNEGFREKNTLQR